MYISPFALKKGDIIFQHNRNEDIRRALTTHVAFVIQERLDGRPYIFDIISSLGLTRRVLPLPKNKVWSVFRQGSSDCSALAALIGNQWLTYNRRESYRHKKDIIHIPGIYSFSSIITAFLGSASYGRQAMKYAEYLYRECRGKPPAELNYRLISLFTGTICAYLPIAIYQATLGMEKTARYMAIDPRKALPKDLAKYLIMNTNNAWRFKGTTDELKNDLAKG